MTLFEAIQERHSVRSFIDKPIPEDTAKTLQNYIDGLNDESGLHMQLVLNEPKAFGSRFSSYGMFRNCSNYIVMAGRPSRCFEDTIGYYGELVVLYAQTLGLNTCWVGLTYRKVQGVFTLAEGEKIACVIALGHGTSALGVSHRIRSIEEVSNLREGHPEWFRQGVEAALLAPTAVNQQKFRFELQDDLQTIKALPGRSLAGYTRIDLGIARCHFDIAVTHFAGDSARYNWV